MFLWLKEEFRSCYGNGCISVGFCRNMRCKKKSLHDQITLDVTGSSRDRADYLLDLSEQWKSVVFGLMYLIQTCIQFRFSLPKRGLLFWTRKRLIPRFFESPVCTSEPRCAVVLKALHFFTDMSSPVCLFCGSRGTVQLYLLDIIKKEMTTIDIHVRSSFALSCFVVLFCLLLSCFLSFLLLAFL